MCSMCAIQLDCHIHAARSSVTTKSSNWPDTQTWSNVKWRKLNSNSKRLKFFLIIEWNTMYLSDRFLLMTLSLWTGHNSRNSRVHSSGRPIICRMSKRSRQSHECLNRQVWSALDSDGWVHSIPAKFSLNLTSTMTFHVKLGAIHLRILFSC